MYRNRGEAYRWGRTAVSKRSEDWACHCQRQKHRFSKVQEPRWSWPARGKAWALARAGSPSKPSLYSTALILRCTAMGGNAPARAADRNIALPKSKLQRICNDWYDPTPRANNRMRWCGPTEDKGLCPREAGRSKRKTLFEEEARDEGFVVRM